MKQIIYYSTKDNKCPFNEWLNKLDKINRYRIQQRLYRIADGNYGDCKHLKNSELQEFRFITNKGYRIYFKDLDEIIILVLAGGDKSNQVKTIEKANMYYDDFKERYLKND